MSSENALEIYEAAKKNYDQVLARIAGLNPDDKDTPKMVNRYAQYIRNMEKQKNGWKFNPSRKPEPNCDKLGCFFSEEHNRCVKNYKYSNVQRYDDRCVCDKNAKGQTYCRRTDVPERAKNRSEFKRGKMKLDAVLGDAKPVKVNWDLFKREDEGEESDDEKSFRNASWFNSLPVPKSFRRRNVKTEKAIKTEKKED